MNNWLSMHKKRSCHGCISGNQKVLYQGDFHKSFYNYNLRSLKLLPIQLTSAVSQACCSLFRRDVSLGFCHHFISNKEFPDSCAP